MGWFDRTAFHLALFSLIVVPTAATEGNGNKGLVHIPLIPHAVQRRRLQAQHGYAPQELVPDRPHQYGGRRQLQLNAAGDPTPVSELFQGYGTHYADLWCGTPPQRQTVIVDTGSGVTAFPCSDCKECGVPKYHSDGLFVEALSTSFEALDCNSCLRGRCRGSECRISMSYQEGSSWTAYEALDNCYVGGMHSDITVDDKGTDYLDPFHAPAFSFGLRFGCQTHLTGLFITQVRGLTGFTMRLPFFFLICTLTFVGMSIQYSLRMVSWEWIMPRQPIGSKCTRPVSSRKRHFRSVLVATKKCRVLVRNRDP